MENNSPKIIIKFESIVHEVKKHLTKTLIGFSALVLISFVLMKIMRKNEFTSSEEIILEYNKKSKTVFGEYTHIKRNGEFFLKLLHHPDILNQTLSDLKSHPQINYEYFHSNLDYARLNCDDQLCAEVTFTSFDRNSDSLLALHLNNYANFLNNMLLHEALDYHHNNYLTSIEELQIEQTELNYKIKQTESLLDSVKQSNLAPSTIKKLNANGININLHDITNKNYELVEEQLTLLKTDLLNNKAIILTLQKKIKQVTKEIRLIEGKKLQKSRINVLENKLIRFPYKNNITPSNMVMVLKSILIGIGMAVLINVLIVIRYLGVKTKETNQENY